MAAAAATAVLVVWVLRSRSRRPRRIDPSGMTTGVYLFTTATCLDCEPARRALVQRLGEDGFREVRWEEEPAWFGRLGIDEVPATLVVDGRGRGRVYRGRPGRSVRLSP